MENLGAKASPEWPRIAAGWPLDRMRRHAIMRPVRTVQTPLLAVRTVQTVIGRCSAAGYRRKPLYRFHCFRRYRWNRCRRCPRNRRMTADSTAVDSRNRRWSRMRSHRCCSVAGYRHSSRCWASSTFRHTGSYSDNRTDNHSSSRSSNYRCRSYRMRRNHHPYSTRRRSSHPAPCC